MTTPNLSLAELVAGQASAEVPINMALRKLDALIFLNVLDRDLVVPPGSPAAGAAYLTAYATYAITAVNTGTKKFTIAGDQTALILATQRFVVAGSTGNDGTYTVVTSTLNTGNTEIVVSETVPSATADGSIRHIQGLWNWDSVGGSVPIGKLAFYSSGWYFITLREGWIARIADEDIFVGYDGTTWSTFGGGGGGSGDMILASAQAVTGAKTFDSSALKVKETGGGSDAITFASPALGANTTITLPSSSGTMGLTKDVPILLRPLDLYPASSNYPTQDTRNNVLVLDFDHVTDETCYGVFIVPPAWVLTSGLVVNLFWWSPATSGNVKWEIAVERMNTDIDSDSFDTVATAFTAVNGTSGIYASTSITITTIDSVAAGEPLRLRIARKPSDTTNDTATDDAELFLVSIVPAV